jgi:hypothetical protein
VKDIEWEYYEDDGWQCTVDDEPSVFWIANPYGDTNIWVLRAGDKVILGGSSSVDFLKEKVAAIEELLGPDPDPSTPQLTIERLAEIRSHTHTLHIVIEENGETYTPEGMVILLRSLSRDLDDLLGVVSK